MFNYYKDIIINDVANTCLVDSDTKMLVVKRGGNYDLSKIEGLKIYKTIGNAGTNAVLKVPFAATTATYDYYQYLIFIDTPEKELGEHAMANWSEFGKPIMVESAASSKNALADAFKMALPYDNPFYTVAAGSGATADLTFAKSWMHVKELKIYKHNATTDKMEEVVVMTPSNRSTYVTTENVPEFATADWLVENLRFPSYPNVRYAHPYSDEAPARGTTYVQYAFNYKTERPVQGGLNVANEEVNAISNHVFYVPSSAATTFEGLLETAGYSKTVTAVPDGQTSKYEITLTAASEEAETEG